MLPVCSDHSINSTTWHHSILIRLLKWVPVMGDSEDELKTMKGIKTEEDDSDHESIDVDEFDRKKVRKQSLTHKTTQESLNNVKQSTQ